MKSVFTAEPAKLLEFKTIRIILLVFCRVVISLLAFAANECYFHSHSVHLPVNLSVLPPSTWRKSLLIFTFYSSSKLSKNEHNKKSSNRGSQIIAYIFTFVKRNFVFSPIIYTKLCVREKKRRYITQKMLILYIL